MGAMTEHYYQAFEAQLRELVKETDGRILGIDVASILVDVTRQHAGRRGGTASTPRWRPASC
jgi:hypothetical protein